MLEGTPADPGPVVAPGSPCSYAPPPEAASPGQSVPCAALDQCSGPFGGDGAYPAYPDVQSSPPNPNGLPPAPGIPIAGRPGAPPPDLPGTPVPLPPERTTGRTHRKPGAGRSDPAAVDVRSGAAAGSGAATGTRRAAPAPFVTPRRSGR